MSDKWMPPKPHFYTRLISNQYRHPLPELVVTEQDFSYWYDREIAPLFENAVEVYGHKDRYDSGWHYGLDRKYASELQLASTHKALLIKIEPLKEVSADDLLREAVGAWYGDGPGINQQMIDKFRAYLEKKK